MEASAMKRECYISRFYIFLLILASLGLAKHTGANEIDYIVYVPESVKILSRTIPMVVMLHGCDQTAKDFETVTGMNDYAEKYQFYVLYPEQGRKRNSMACWNWFDKSNEAKKRGEASAIIQIMERVMKDNPQIDRSHIYIAGLSAGGAMAGILASCYKEYFKAFAIHSSVSFIRAHNLQQGLHLMRQGPGKKSIGHKSPCNKDPKLPLLVIHGDRDEVVNPSNTKVLIKDLGDPDKSELKIIAGLGHAWSGGKKGMKYSSSNPPRSSELIWSFFKQF